MHSVFRLLIKAIQIAGIQQWTLFWEIKQINHSEYVSLCVSPFHLNSVFQVLDMLLVNISTLPADIMKCVSAVKQNSTKVMSLTQQKEGL